MTESTSVLNTPVLWINKYLQEKLSILISEEVNNRGLWSFSIAYSTNDLVEYLGIYYVAKRASTNKAPNSSSDDWQIFDISPDLVPFFPTGPTTLETLQTQFPEGGTMAVWDRMFKMRRGPFPHIKCEQLLYYFYATGLSPNLRMIKIQEAIMRLLDRGDESAQDVNLWAKNHGPIDGMDCKFYFHDFKIYQLEEARDIVDFGTARTYAGNKIIIDYDYHQMPDIINSIN
jgi:hypothetical protein